MPNVKQVILKDPKTGQYLSPKVYGALTYEPVPEGGGSVPPYEGAVNEDMLNAALETKADVNHTHTVSQITDMPDLTNVIPSGIICMWSGESTAIPSGWNLCDGSNGTPDLRDRFIVGAGNTYKVKDTGGEATHTLTTNEMPSHNHGFTGTAHNHTGSLSSATAASAGSHTHTMSENLTAASNGSHTHTASGGSSGGYVIVGPLLSGSAGSELPEIGRGRNLTASKVASLWDGQFAAVRDNDDYGRLDVQGSSGSTISINSGGAHTHSISGTITAANSGSHTHSVTGSVTVNSATAGGTVGSTGGGQAHENRPPYFALCFIMKL